MMQKKGYFTISAAVAYVLLSCTLDTAQVFARGPHGTNVRHHGDGSTLSAQMPPAEYKESCGTCHMAYPAFLLPEAAWNNILVNLGDHFDSEVVLDASDKTQVTSYLFLNSADKSGTRLSSKVMASLGNQIPERISTQPFIQRVHRRIKSADFTQPEVGGIQNCISCHNGAEQGVFKAIRK